MEAKKCLHCGCEFAKHYHESRNSYAGRKYCSKGCSNAARRGRPLSEEHKKKLGEKSLGRKHLPETIAKISGANSRHWKGGKPKCSECGCELASTRARRCFPCYAKQAVGSKSSHWLGGITPERAKIRNSAEMLEWRKSVFQRDNYTCQICGVRGAHLHAHHIVPFSVDESLRFDVGNGQTLCKTCHKMVHSGVNGMRKPAIIKGLAT